MTGKFATFGCLQQSCTIATQKLWINGDFTFVIEAARFWAPPAITRGLRHADGNGTLGQHSDRKNDGSHQLLLAPRQLHALYDIDHGRRAAGRGTISSPFEQSRSG